MAKKGNGADAQVDLLLQVVARLEKLEERVETGQQLTNTKLDAISARLGETNATLRLVAETLSEAVRTIGGRFEDHERRIAALEKKAS